MNRTEQPEMVVAIPSRGLVAKFHHNHGRFGWRPVLAFDDAGYALVADMRVGRLVRAADNPVFVGLEPAAAARKPHRNGTPADGAEEADA